MIEGSEVHVLLAEPLYQSRSCSTFWIRGLKFLQFRIGSQQKSHNEPAEEATLCSNLKSVCLQQVKKSDSDQACNRVKCMCICV